MLQLRRVTDQVFNRRTGDRIASGLEQVRGQAAVAAERGTEIAHKAYDRGSDAARMAYQYAMNHRKTTGAVLLGTGIAAALLWMVSRNGGYSAMRRKVLQRVRSSSGTRSRARRRVTNATE